LKTTVSEPECWKRVVEIEVPEVDAAVDAKLAELKRGARMPGFRPGKVPLAVIKQRYGKAARAEAVETVMQEAFKSACEEHKIAPVSEAKLTDMKGGEGGEALRFTIETEVDPPIEITGYDKLKIKAKPVKVTDSMVDGAFNELLDRYAAFDDVKRPAKKGDYLRIMYKSVSIDGVDRPDLKGHCPEYPIELGGEGVFKEFDKGLTGKLSVQERHPPTFNEKLMERLGGVTADMLRDEIRKSMEARVLREAKEAAHNEAIDELIKENPMKLAPSAVDRLARGLIEDYFKRSNEPETEMSQEMQEKFYGVAALMLKRMKIINYVADKEKIKATQEEVDKEIMTMAQMYGHQDFETLKQMLRKDGTTNRIRADIRERKTLDFLIGEGKAE